MHITQSQLMHMEFCQHAESAVFFQVLLGCGFLMLWLSSNRSKEGWIALFFGIFVTIMATIVVMTGWQQ